jgi:hypothetical protein
MLLQVFKREADLLENWIVSREPLLHDGKFGETIAQVEDLIRKHEDFEKTIEAQEDKFSALRRVTMVSLYRLLSVSRCSKCKHGLCIHMGRETLVEMLVP